MDVELTKDAKKILKRIYKEYKRRLKAGKTFSEAVDFEDSIRYYKDLFPGWDERLTWSLLYELSKQGLIKKHQRGSFVLLREGILFMEQRRRRFVKTTFEKLLLIIKSLFSFFT